MGGAFAGKMMRDLNYEGIYQPCGIRAEDGATSPVISPVTLTKTTSTNRARSSNVATITTNTAHGIAVGQTFTISGVTGAAYNGTFVATSGTTGSTLKYASTGTDQTATADVGGTIYPHLALTPAAGDLSVTVQSSAALRVSENNVMDGSATGKGYWKLAADSEVELYCADAALVYARGDAATAIVSFRFNKA